MCTEERRELLKKGLEIRRRIADYRQKLHDGEIDPLELLWLNDEYEVGRMRVEYFLMSLKGIGKVKTRKIARRLDLPPRCRLEDLKRDKLVKLSKIVEKHQ